MPSRRASRAPFRAVKISGRRSSADRLAVDLQQLERDRVVGAARHGDVPERRGPAEHLRRTRPRTRRGRGRTVSTRVPSMSHRTRRTVLCIHVGSRTGPQGLSRATDSVPRGQGGLPHGITTSRDPGPVPRCRTARRGAGGGRGGRRRQTTSRARSSSSASSSAAASARCSCCARAGSSTVARWASRPRSWTPSTAPRSARTWARAAPPPFRGRAIVTEDIREDPKWEPFRALAADAGLRSCWSVPLRLSGGPVLGTFAAYEQVPGTPEPGDLELAEAHASLVALGLDRLSREERLSESYEAVVVALSLGARRARRVHRRALHRDRAHGGRRRLPDGPRQGRPPAPRADGDAPRHRQARDPDRDPPRAAAADRRGADGDGAAPRDRRADPARHPVPRGGRPRRAPRARALGRRAATPTASPASRSRWPAGSCSPATPGTR